MHVVLMDSSSQWGSQNGWHFADDISKYISFNENVQNFILTSLQFVSKVLIHDAVIKWKNFPRYWPGNLLFTGEFPSQRPVTRRFDVFFDQRLNKRLSKQSWGWWFEMPLRPLWHYCNMMINQIWLKFHCNVFLIVVLMLSQHWLR